MLAKILRLKVARRMSAELARKMKETESLYSSMSTSTFVPSLLFHFCHGWEGSSIVECTYSTVVVIFRSTVRIYSIR
jgi:hypothetical protein